MPLKVSRDVRPLIQMRLGPRAFSRDCTEDSDFPLSCEMKDEPAFKPHQENLTLFLVRESRYPLQLRLKTAKSEQGGWKLCGGAGGELRYG